MPETYKQKTCKNILTPFKVSNIFFDFAQNSLFKGGMNVSCQKAQHCQETKQKREKVLYTNKKHYKVSQAHGKAPLFLMCIKFLHTIKGTS